MNKIIPLLIGTLFFITACTDNTKPTDALAHLKNKELKSFLEKVFEAHGGLEEWNSIISLKYHKDFALFLEDSTVEKSSEQFHHYNYQPETIIKIISQEGETSKRLVLDNDKIQETINGTVNLEAKESSLRNQLQSSLFVISQPFKLADQGAMLTYEGVKKIDKQNVHVLKAVYDPTTHEHHTTPDTWWLYFDEQTYLMESYMVQHKDHFSLIKNLETKKVDGFTFPVKRESFRANADGEILYLRANYAYRDFVIVK